MPRGQPDFGAYAAETYVTGMSDMAELAARLGSIVLFDRKGKVVDLDDFEAPLLKWRTTVAGSATIALDDTQPKSGAQGVKIYSSGAEGDAAYIRKGFIALPSKRIGTEISFSLASNKTSFHAKLDYYNGAVQYRCYVKLDFTDNKIYYRPSGGGWTELAEITAIHSLSWTFTPVKVVADFDTGYYVKLILGSVEYDMTDLAMQFTGDTTYPRFFIEYRLDREADGEGQIYLDDFILTQDEP